MDNPQEYWGDIYQTKSATEVSWYQPTPDSSLSTLEALGITSDASLIDVGGGASVLIDYLLERGWSDLTVLDIAAPALDVSKARLGSRAPSVQWQVADVADWLPLRTYDVWHDRAVFHFLTEPEQRSSYRKTLEAATHGGSIMVIATFALDGPERCSGLPVRRYDAEALAAEFGSTFMLKRAWEEVHVTPVPRQHQWHRFEVVI